MMRQSFVPLALAVACFWTLASLTPCAAGGNLSAGGGKKLQVPSDAVQAAAMKIVKELYGAEYAKATSLAAKQELAKKLLDQGKGMQDDSAGKFVLLKLARDIATQGLDGWTAFHAVDAIAETFEIDPVEMKASILRHGAEHAKTPQQHRLLLEGALPLVDVAIAEDNYSIARQVCDFAANEATAASDSDKRSYSLKRGEEVENVLAALYDKAQNATAMLSADPVNPQANAVLGKYLCFVKGDWDRGILMLALGSDEGLKSMAQKELEELSPTPPGELGDGWWQRAEKEDGCIRSQTQVRAAYWYRKALPGLSGLAQARIEKRLQSLTGQLSSPAIADRSVAKAEPLPEHKSWTVPFTWREQEQRWKTVIEYSPGQHGERRIPYMVTVTRHGTKTVDGSLVKYDYKKGDVALKLIVETDVNGRKNKEEMVRSFRYAALGEEDRKYLDAVKRNDTGQ